MLVQSRGSQRSHNKQMLWIYLSFTEQVCPPFNCLFHKQKAELKLTSAYEPTRFAFRSWQERSVHACQWHPRTVLLTGECHPLWRAWHPEDAAKTEGRVANPEQWRKYCISSASQIPRLKPGTRGETDVTVRLLRHPWCDLPRGVLISYLTGWVISASLDSEKEKIILWLGKASNVDSTEKQTQNLHNWQEHLAAIYRKLGALPALIITVSLPTFGRHLSSMTHIHFCSKAYSACLLENSVRQLSHPRNGNSLWVLGRK